MEPRNPPKALSIAGSDSGGGAGIQADLKTFSALGVYGTTAITAITAQNTRGVSAVHAVPPDMVAAQIDAVLGDIGADAVKIGMLANADIVATVARRLERHKPRYVVLDPVMVAASGDRLLDESAVGVLVERLLPLCSVVTPNLDEAALLTGRPVGSPEAMEEAATAILAMGAPAVLVKGGHLPGDEVLDLYLSGTDRFSLVNKRLNRSGHGTGCTLSSALAAYGARGMPLKAAFEAATAFVHESLAVGFRIGGGETVVLDHFAGRRRA